MYDYDYVGFYSVFTACASQLIFFAINLALVAIILIGK